MNLEDYKRKNAKLYTDFAALIRKLIKKALNQRKDLPKLQSSKHRSKDAKSLQTKLIDRNLQNSENNDLIDVNVDIERGIDPNRNIEEVTFVSKVDGKHMLGSLPMILPRLDRDWDEGMSPNKHAQYRRVFGLDKDKYKGFQKLLKSEGEYPLGKLTEHLIQHHGKLMRKIAIKSDRAHGYHGNFVVTKNPGYCGPVDDINKEGQELRTRDARTGSAEKKSRFLEENKEPETPNKAQVVQKASVLIDTSQRKPIPVVPYFKTESSGHLKLRQLSQKHEDEVDEITEKLSSMQSGISKKSLAVK